LDYGFSARRAVDFPEVKVPPLAIVGGLSSEVALQCEDPLPITVPVERCGEATVTVHLPPFLFAPVKAGAIVGRVEYRFEGETIQNCDIRTTDTVPVLPPKCAGAYFWQYLRLLIKGLFC